MEIELRMKTDNIKTIEDISAFINVHNNTLRNVGIHFANKKAAYNWILEQLVKFNYITQRKKNKTIIRRYITLCTGYSRQQLDRLVQQYKLTGYIKTHYNTNNMGRFKPKYTTEDIKLLVETDKLHNTPSGPALKRIFQRMYHTFKKQEYKNLSKISVAQIYNIRNSKKYKALGGTYDHTAPVVRISIGTKSKPQPNGKPGYIRVDTVHQGKFKDNNSIYHIHAIDEVTQYEAIVAVPEINQTFMLPALEKLLNMFPFKIIEFHSDNGSEFINYKVLELLNKSNTTLTRSRSRKHNDNALVEGKNGAIIRKHIGYGYIDPKILNLVNTFYKDYFIPYLNYSRPCAFAVTTIDKKGKIKKKYPQHMYKTPFEKLLSIPNVENYLKDSVSLDQLKQEAMAVDDNTRAKQMLEAKTYVLQFAELPKFHELDILKLLQKLKLNSNSDTI